jgi:hypothetical protein
VTGVDVPLGCAPLLSPQDDDRRDPRCPLDVDSGRSTPKIFYAETFATTIRTISGLSRQTPSLRIPKIDRIENMSLYKFQHRTDDIRPLGLH